MTETTLAPSYTVLKSEFEAFVKENLKENFPGVIKYCVHEIVRVLRSGNIENEENRREVKTEILKQKKALLSIVDLMNGKDSLRPAYKFVDNAIPRLSEIANSINAEIYTTQDYSEKPIFSLELS